MVNTTFVSVGYIRSYSQELVSLVKDSKHTETAVETPGSHCSKKLLSTRPIKPQPVFLQCEFCTD